MTFTGESGERAYTGSEIELTGVTANQGEDTGLASGHTSNVAASAKGTVAGTYPGTITAKGDVKISDADGNDVTANYTVNTVAGTLTITGVEGTIVITADSAEKVYDGAALTDGGWTTRSRAARARTPSTSPRATPSARASTARSPSPRVISS